MTGAPLFARQNIWPALSGVFVFIAFAFGVFFSGFDKPYFAPSLILIAGIAGVALAPGFRRGWSFPVAAPALCLVLFWWWLALSLSWSQVPYVSAIFLMTLSTLPLLFFAIAQNHNAKNYICAGRIALIAGVSCLALWAAFQFLFLRDLTGVRIHHPMLNANNLGVVLMLGIFLLLSVFSRTGAALRILCGGLMALMLFALMATQSRAASLGLGLGLLVYAVCCFDTIKTNWKAFAFLLLVLLATGSAYFTILLGQINLGSIHLIGGADAHGSAVARVYLWGAGAAMFRDYALGFLRPGGAGLGTFYLTFPPYRWFEDASDGFFLHVDPIQFGIETGFPATLLFYAFCICALLFFLRAVRTEKTQDKQPDRIEMVCGFSGLLGLLVNAHLDFDLYMVPAEMMAAYLFLAFYGGAENILGRKRLPLRLGRMPDNIFLVPALALTLILGPLWVLSAGAAVHYDALALRALRAGDINATIALSARALRWGPGNYSRAYYIDSLWRARVLKEKFAVLEPQSRETLFETALTRLDQSLVRNPYSTEARSAKALLYFMAFPQLAPDGLDKALHILEVAMKKDPVNFDLRMGSAKILEMQHRPAQGIAILENGLRYALAQSYAPAAYFLLLSQLKRQTGNAAEADKLLARAQARNKQAMESIKGQQAFPRWLNGKVNSLVNSLE